MRRWLGDAISALPAEQRRVVMLTCLEGRSYTEIAEIAGRHVNTVKTRMKALLAEQRGAA
ncbi:MAG: hypothetical protein IT518_11455 [Burkholderiales bacterium]|nr:hypothetical protein [Burkholderiales bacterium]